MKHRFVLVLAVAAATVGFVPGSAHAAPTGALCGVVTRETSPGTHAGYLFGGPLVGDGTLRCSVQASPAHSDSDLDWDSAENNTVVTLNPKPITFPFSGEDLYLCTQWTGSNGTVYLGSDHRWHDTDATAECPRTRSPNAAAQDAWEILCATLPLVFTGTLLGTVTIEHDGDTDVNGTPVIVCSAPNRWAFAGLSIAPTTIRIGG